jgi:hypothetical protein
MSEERVAKMNVFNKKYLEKLDEEKRTRESLRKTVTQ